MAPTIHCIRHGQGFHNLYSDYTLPDPCLTPLGEEQCATLQSTHFPLDKQKSISLVAASPLTRALHTAWLVFQPILTLSASPQINTKAGGNQMKILAIPDAQETSSDPCDVGTDLSGLSSFLASQHPAWPVDLSLLASNPGWNRKSLGSRFSPHNDAIKARARATRLFLRDRVDEIMTKEGRDDIQVVLVSHGGFLHYFSDDWEGAATRPGTGFTNCEVRSYQFASSLSASDSSLIDKLNNDVDAKVVETMSSRHARGLAHPMYGPLEQEHLFLQAMEGWEAQGLERPDRLEDPTLASAFVPVSSPQSQIKTVKKEMRQLGAPVEEQQMKIESQCSKIVSEPILIR